MRVLALIPARGGSKGVPRKNLRQLAGKPLIYWSINAAQKAEGISCVAVSSEDPEIITLSRSLGVNVALIRPNHLSEDETPGVLPVIHAAENMIDFEWILVLQPTSPMRSAADIEGMLELQKETGAESLVSVSPVNENPEHFFRLQSDQTLAPLMREAWEMKRRQDNEQFYRLNGAMYLVSRRWLLEHQTLVNSSTLGYMMPADRSIDIDSYADFKFAGLMMEEQAD
jgi:CMP-N-acetylneuraminic acid synthetase